MVKEFEQTGHVRPAGKLDPYAERIVEMIAQEPARSTNGLHKDFMEREQMKVAYSRFSKFIAELGFARRPETNRLPTEERFGAELLELTCGSFLRMRA
jgi:hypothetical protein